MTDKLIRLGPAAAHNRSTSYPASKRVYNDGSKESIAVVKFLGSNGLAFRGTDERFNSITSGNYINTLKLLAKFDAFIAGHIAKYADKGRGSVSYLSSTIADESIAVIAEKITDTIVAELKKAKYYSISVDSSPDISHFHTKRVYFFTASTHRWKVLTDHFGDKLVPKNLADTRWSVHAQAISALKEGYDQLDVALQEIANDLQQKPSTRHEAENLSATLSIWDVPLLTELWNQILHRINSVNKCLQDASLDLSETYLLNSLVGYFKSLRERSTAILLDANNISQKERKDPSRGSCKHRGQHSTSKIDLFRINVFLPIIDLLIVELIRRTEVYKDVYSLFGFLINLCATAPREEVVEKVQHLISKYPEDLKDIHEIIEEVIHYRILMSVVPREELRIKCTSRNLGDDNRISFGGVYLYLCNHSIDSVFPNVTIALRICLTIMCAVATDERCFNYMKHLKNVLRTSMSEDRFTDLAMITIERELLEETDDKEIISKFVDQKFAKIYESILLNLHFVCLSVCLFVCPLSRKGSNGR
ncbi:Zinc finger MYM-type protein 1 [Oopsacas minuta]|uniref:Zinc finger MYM-type protein 1 n=1 Tax=Oopsacas minuta TaxID=111878 RepID=A0AAV7JQJ0_9METZ|nr:Zinc finger MYM-type protein 1 [Oopsacas minuta]